MPRTSPEPWRARPGAWAKKSTVRLKAWWIRRLGTQSKGARIGRARQRQEAPRPHQIKAATRGAVTMDARRPTG